MSGIVTRPTGDNEIEFDFIHTITCKRIRRKVRTKGYIAEMIVKVLEDMFRKENSSMTFKDFKERTEIDPLFYPCADEVIRICEILFSIISMMWNKQI
jgi:hypothetical protein